MAAMRTPSLTRREGSAEQTTVSRYLGRPRLAGRCAWGTVLTDSKSPHPDRGRPSRNAAGSMQPILVFDTYSLFFRAFHALPPMSTKRGEPTSAVHGLTV